MRPTSEQLEVLTPFERASFELADFFARPALTPISAAWNSAFMGALIYSCGGRRMNVQGMEYLQSLGKKDSVLLVANHRSFFDFFTITALCYWRTNLTKRIFFPVRHKFFYTHPAGPLVNAIMSGMRMFPPVMREKEKKAFNTYSVERCLEELNRTDIGTILGIHPEGTRNKDADPYSFLPAQPGVGRLALGASSRVKVIPVYVLGMGQSIPGEWRMNFLDAPNNPVDVFFGEPLNFDDLRPKAAMITTQKRAADRCLDAIKALAEKQRQAAAIRDGRDPGAERSVMERPAVKFRAGAGESVPASAP